MSWISGTPVQADLEQTRGDSATITFAHTFGASGNVAEARLMVRERPDGDLLLILTKTADSGQWSFATSNVGVITILPVDTDGLEAGAWYYDIEVEHTNGTVTTFQKGRYYLRADVVNDGEGGFLPIVNIDIDRQGGSAADWNTVGTTNYDVLQMRLQVGAEQIAAGSITITFPTAFLNKPVVFVQVAGSSAIFATVSGITATQATIYVFEDDGNPPAGATNVYWLAAGL